MSNPLLLALLLIPAASAAKPSPKAPAPSGKKLAVESLAKAEAELRRKIAESGLAPAFADPLAEQAGAVVARAGCDHATGSLRCPGRPAPVVEKARKELDELAAEVDAEFKRYGARTPKELFEPRSEAALALIDRLPDGDAKEHFLASLRRLGGDFRSRVAYEQAVARLEALKAEIEAALDFTASRR